MGDIFQAGATIAGAGIQASAAESAAQTQASAEDQASQLEYQASQNALGFSENEFNTQQQNEAPFLAAGQGAVTNLSSLLAPGGALSQQWTGQFQAPTDVTMQNDPAYQFDLQQGQQALDRSAAATGVATSGGAAKALEQYTQSDAANAYQQVYNNQLQQYQQSYNQFQQGQTNTFNRLASLAGVGQTATQQLGQEGTAEAQNVTSNELGTAAQIGSNTAAAGNAIASGYVGVGNAINSGLSGLSGLAQLSSMNGGGGGWGSLGSIFSSGNTSADSMWGSGVSGDSSGLDISSDLDDVGEDVLFG